MRALSKTLWLVPFALAGCTTTPEEAGRSNDVTVATSSAAAATPGNVRMGDTVATMADQYNRPHPGPAGTGASTWVQAPPPPAYVDTSAPPPRAADPAPLAAVANRQPSAAPARPAAALPEAERPEVAMANGGSGATPTRQAAALSAAEVTKGRALFASNGCGGCHKLDDAGGAGGIGPSFDGNRGLTRDSAFQTIHDGRGAMPSFAGQISDADIRTLAAYIVQVKK